MCYCINRSWGWREQNGPQGKKEGRIIMDNYKDVIVFLRNQGNKLLSLADTIERELSGATKEHANVSLEALKHVMGQRAWRKNQIAQALSIQDPSILDPVLNNTEEFERNKRGWYTVKTVSLQDMTGHLKTA
jgi:hypothetical protein